MKFKSKTKLFVAKALTAMLLATVFFGIPAENCTSAMYVQASSVSENDSIYFPPKEDLMVKNLKWNGDILSWEPCKFDAVGGVIYQICLKHSNGNYLLIRTSGNTSFRLKDIKDKTLEQLRDDRYNLFWVVDSQPNRRLYSNSVKIILEDVKKDFEKKFWQNGTCTVDVGVCAFSVPGGPPLNSGTGDDYYTEPITITLNFFDETTETSDITLNFFDETTETNDISDDNALNDKDENAIRSVRAQLSDAGNKNINYDGGDFARVPEESQKEIYSDIKGTDKEVTFVFTKNEKEYTWTFEGKDINDASSDILVSDFDIELQTDNPEILGKLPAGTNAVNLRFAHEGELPAKATVSVSVEGYGFADGSVLNLYYFNPATQSLELSETNIRVSGQRASFHINHCSDYVLAAASAGAGTTGVTSPKTGEQGGNLWMLFASGLFATAVFGAVYGIKRMKSTDNK